MAARTRHSLVFRPHEDHIERGKNGLSEFAQPVWRSERPKQTISPKATDSLLCETPCIMTDSRNDLANFADDRVGAASGVYQVVRKDEAELGGQEDLYWKYETFLKVQEANIGALAGAHGSLYAMRKSLYPFPPVGTINDDFVIPTSVLHRGFRIAYEPQAIAYEEAHEMEGFRRRIRITAGNVELYTEGRRAATSAGHRGAGGQSAVGCRPNPEFREARFGTLVASFLPLQVVARSRSRQSKRIAEIITNLA